MTTPLDEEYEAYMSRFHDATIYVPRKLSYRERWQTAKLLHILIAIAFVGCALPILILFVGIGALGILATIKG